MRRIRPAAEADLARVHEVCIAAFEPVHEGFAAVLGPEIFAAEYGDWRTDYAGTLQAAMADAETAFHVVEEGGRVVSFVLSTVNHAKALGEIGLNAVDPPHQRRGIAREMYAFVLDDLARRGARFATVGTGADHAHAAARAAYAAAGFDRAIPALYLYRRL
jgi:GNAT superfamily N-acetyltransferase